MTKAKEALPRCKPAPQDDFNRYDRAAGTPGAPLCPLESGWGKSKSISNSRKAFDLIKQKLVELREAGGVALVYVTVATNYELLDLLAACNSILLIDKTNPHTPLVRAYNSITAGFNRRQMPGNVFKHLVPLGNPDYGLIDGVRQVGNFYHTMRKLINEKRPLMHRKVFVGLLPIGKKGELVPVFAFSGSMNWSWNALSSFEMVEYTEDAHKAQFFYDVGAHTWSLSEGLYEITSGLTPAFEWQNKLPKFQALPKCTDCGGNDYAPYWWQPKHESYASRMLRCIDCNELVPY